MAPENTRRFSRAVRGLIILTVLGFTAGPAAAQIPQFKLENPQSGYPTGRMGNSVAMDGETMIVGAPSTDRSGLEAAGTARVYLSDGMGGWVLQAELTASDAADYTGFGESVSLSGDTAVVGAYASTYIFTRSGSTWNQQAKITASDAAAEDTFGSSVSLSGDTAVIGAFGDDGVGGDSGSAYVFTRNGSTWTQQAKLTASDAAAGDRFGMYGGLQGIAGKSLREIEGLRFKEQEAPALENGGE